MDNIPPEIRRRIALYTPAGGIQCRLDTLNSLVRAASTMRLFRPLTLASLLDRSMRIWMYEMQENSNIYGMFFALQDFLVVWITNNGVNWSFQEKQRVTQDLCLALLDWFRVV